MGVKYNMAMMRNPFSAAARVWGENEREFDD
jgi:hypothetical protein